MIHAGDFVLLKSRRALVVAKVEIVDWRNKLLHYRVNGISGIPAGKGTLNFSKPPLSGSIRDKFAGAVITVE